MQLTLKMKPTLGIKFIADRRGLEPGKGGKNKRRDIFHDQLLKKETFYRIMLIYYLENKD